MTDETPSQLQATLPAYERAARRQLDAPIDAYFFGGAGAQVTLRRNLCDLESIQLVPRHLSDLRQGTTRTVLFGQSLDAPILVAPVAFQNLLHPDGESGAAAAATAQGCGMALSLQASQPMASVREAGENCQWMQLYWQTNRETTLGLAERAAECGFTAIVLTVDAPVNGVRDAEMEAGFTLPHQGVPPNLASVPQPRFAPLTDGESMIFDRIAHVLPSWSDVEWLCGASPLPVLLKGVLHPDDALRGRETGASGIIVSNHGGRVLDGAPSAISVLPDVVDAVGKHVPVLMDGGIRRGSDVFKALALGARAVLVGRPVCHGLAVAGAMGASHVLRLLRDELEVTMALTGCPRIDAIPQDAIRIPNGGFIS